jgi:PadR family transcriptional regulator, regulatory protein PadR
MKERSTPHSCGFSGGNGLLQSEGTSENNRKAKYYSLTKGGRKRLARETENWERIAGAIGRLLRLEGQE